MLRIINSLSMAFFDGHCLCAQGNVYAANGIGAVLAEQGRFAEAREIFTEVPPRQHPRMQCPSCALICSTVLCARHGCWGLHA